jgi:hypothetical protein
MSESMSPVEKRASPRATGKLVCTGAKSEDMVDEAVAKLHGTLEDYTLIL